MLRGIFLGRRALQDQPALEGEPVEFNEEDFFGPQTPIKEDDDEKGKEVIYLAVIGLVTILVLFMCIVVMMVVRSIIRKELSRKDSDDTLSIADDGLAESSNNKKGEPKDGSSDSKLTDGVSIPLPASLTPKGSQQDSRNVTAFEFRDAAHCPRIPVARPEPAVTATKEVEAVAQTVSDTPRTYSSTMRQLLAQVENLSSQPLDLPVGVIGEEKEEFEDASTDAGSIGLQLSMNVSEI